MLEQVQSLVRSYTPVLLEALLELPPEEVPESPMERQTSWKKDNMWMPDLDLWALGTRYAPASGYRAESCESAVLARVPSFGQSWGGCRTEAHQEYCDFDEFHDTALDDLIGW